MDGIWMVAAGLVVGGSVAVAVALRRRAREAEAAAARLAARAEELAAEVRRLAEERTRLEVELDAERRAATERAAEATRAREQVRAEVEKLAARVLDEKGRALLDRSQERLAAVLGPVGEKLKAFELRIERTYGEEARERASLREHLKALQESQARLHQDAEALSRALTRDSKQQGDWGEIVLERVLEAAGLTRGREYELQVNHVDEEGGRKRPDALVFLPEDRAIVVDAKCSLKAFVDASRATGDADRDRALDAHVVSLRAHVKGLAGKRYTEVLRQRSLDFVMMFVPSEAGFVAGLSRDPALWEDAFRQGVVITSPTTLVAALRLVAQLWRTESQNQNARDIAEEAGKLLEKLATFVADLDAVGDRLAKAQDAFTSARAKLATGRGNVLGRAERIASLGAPVKTERARELLASRRLEEGPDAPAAGAAPEADAAVVEEEV
jgi:DNA recombination protein RmuC